MFYGRVNKIKKGDFMVFIGGRVLDEEREPKVLAADGVVNADLQRDYDLIWNESEEVSEVL